MIRSRIAALAVAPALLTVACGGASDAPATVTVHDTPSATAAEQDHSWTMPDLRGRNLQDAQDAIQALTNNEVFFSGSTDLTGKSRKQVLDRNWQVCTSTPAPGETFTKSTSINFGVVKIDNETCP